jgi:hypothetical protein
VSRGSSIVGFFQSRCSGTSVVSSSTPITITRCPARTSSRARSGRRASIATIIRRATCSASSGTACEDDTGMPSASTDLT